MTPPRVSSLDEDIGRIVAHYAGRGPRDSLEGVRRLRELLAPPRLLRVGVVGTNGKTSTATYLARLLTANGFRTGLYVSPHLSDWTERVRVDDLPCDPEQLVSAVTAVHELAGAAVGDPGQLRFFDILTLAAEQLIAESGATFGVFEAGIGGRLDALSALEPRLVLLTSVAIDHAELLGEEPAEVLREKLLVAPAGATVIAARLPDELTAAAERIAAERDLRLAWVDPASGGERARDLPAYLRSALALAERGCAAAGVLWETTLAGAGAIDPRAPLDLRLPGRLEWGEFGGVPYVLDVAHNEAAWLQLAAELARPGSGLGGEVPLTVLIAVSPGKRTGGLAEALEALPALERAIVTRSESMPAIEPEDLAASLAGIDADVVAIEDLGRAVGAAFESARRAQGAVLVCGSTHLVGAVRPRLTGAA